MPERGSFHIPDQEACPHGRVGECWACEDEENPHAEFAQQMDTVARGLSKIYGYRDEEDQLERAITREGFGDTAPDSHLEDMYDWQQSGDES